MPRPPTRIQSAPTRRRPMSPLIPLAILLLAIVGALFFFAHHAGEQPMRTIEVDVPRDSAAH